MGSHSEVWLKKQIISQQRNAKLIFKQNERYTYNDYQFNDGTYTNFMFMEQEKDFHCVLVDCVGEIKNTKPIF